MLPKYQLMTSDFYYSYWQYQKIVPNSFAKKSVLF